MNKTVGRAERNRLALDTSHISTTLKGRTVRGGAINMMSQVVALVMQIGSMAVFARLLAPADYGVLAMASTVIVFAALFTNMGLTTPTIQRPVITPEQVSTLFYIALGGGFLAAGVCCLSAPFFVDLFHNSATRDILYLLSLTIPMAAAGSQFNAVLIRNMEWKKIQAINLGSQFFGIITGLLLAWKAHWGVYALAAQQLAGSTAALCLNVIFCRWRPSLTFSLEKVRSELSMGMDMLLFGVFNYLHRQFDNIIIGARWGPIELGLYSRAYNVMTQANFGLVGPLSSALVPSLSRVSHEPERWRRHFILSAVVMTTCVGFVFTLLFVNTREIVSILFGDRWNNVAPLLRFLLVAGLATAVHSPFSWIFPSLGHTRRQLLWSIISAPVLVAAFWYGSTYGAWGVALAYATTMVVINFVYTYIAVRDTPVSYLTGISLIVPIYITFSAVGYICFIAHDIVDAYGNVFITLIGNSVLASILFLVMLYAITIIVPSYRVVRAKLLLDIGFWLKARRSQT